MNREKRKKEGNDVNFHGNTLLWKKRDPIINSFCSHFNIAKEKELRFFVVLQPIECYFKLYKTIPSSHF